MLKQRVLTAIVLTLFLLLMLFGLPAIYFPWFIGGVVLIGAWEWANLASLGAGWQRGLYTVFIAFLVAGVGHAVGLYDTSVISLNSAFIQQLLVVACVWWAVALLLVQGYPTSALLWGHRLLRLVIGVLVLVPTWLALVYARFQPQGAWLVLLIIGIVAAADIGGYFTGRRFGKRKLAPKVSPGKTLEGFGGGLVCNVLLAIVVAYVTKTNAWLLLAIVIPTSLFSVLGDLLESMLKRHAGVKDSGAILPGHGGVLDRVDSITAAAPVFSLALIASGWQLG